VNPSLLRIPPAAPPAWRQRLGHHHQLPDGTRLYLRSMMAADLRGADAYFGRLSERSRYLRFMSATRSLPADALRTLARQSRDRRCAVVVAFVRHAGTTEIVGGARLVGTARRSTCEFALTVVDAWQGRGIGRALLREMVRRAPALGYTRIEGFVLAGNSAMLSIAHHLGLRVCVHRGDRGAVVVWRRVWRRAGGRVEPDSGITRAPTTASVLRFD